MTSKSTWAEALSTPRFRVSCAGVMITFFLTLTLFTRFLVQIELREGVQLTDPLLTFLPIVKLDELIFALVYGAILMAFFSMRSNPKRMMLTLQAYTLMMIIRVIAMTLVPLDPPSGMILLNDPFSKILSTSGIPFTRDLFFSGHTATVFLMYLGVQSPRWVKVCLFLMFLGVGISVLFSTCTTPSMFSLPHFLRMALFECLV